MSYPIPNIDELLDELHGATIFSKINPSSVTTRYDASPDMHKTVFWTHSRHYEFLVIFFGLINANLSLLVHHEWHVPTLPSQSYLGIFQ